MGLALALASVLSAVPPAAASGQPVAGQPVVVELYTSQGCASCPPADAYLAELARKEGILALSLHVDYWDYIGWKDLFALPENSLRQRDYAQHFGQRYVYTPQMVIHGTTHESGAQTAAVAKLIAKTEKAIAEAQAAGRTVPVAIRPLPDGRLEVSAGAGPGLGEAELWLFSYDREQQVKIKRGENKGKTLTYANVVRSLERLALWEGEPVSVTVPAPRPASEGGCAALLQPRGLGPVLGAAKLSLP